MVVMTTSRRFVRLGRKFCLFVYYVEQINNKEWMVKEPATFNGSVESRTMHDNIRRRNKKQCRRFVWFILSCFKKVKVEFVEICSCCVFFYYRYTSDYIMASHVFLLVLNSIRG
jgi:hypothetical protein